MWNTLQVLYKGTEVVKDLMINKLTKEYERFHMEHRETVEGNGNRRLRLSKNQMILTILISQKYLESYLNMRIN